MASRSVKRVLVASAVLLSMLALPAVAGAQSVTIDFESFPGPDGAFGTPDDIAAPPCPGGICSALSSEFTSFGMTFTRGNLGDLPLFPGAPAGNHFITSSPPDATFTRAVAGISITSYSFWTATLYALDSTGAVIASDTLVHPSPGTSFFLGTLSVTTTVPIARFTVLPAGCTIGGPCSQILNLDDLVLTAPAPPPPPPPPAITDVPALSPWGAAGLATLLAMIGSVAIRRRSSASAV